MNSRKATSIVLLLLGMATTACSERTDNPDRIQVVATTSIWGDVVSEVVGDQADIRVLIPDGTDPHEFALSAEDAAAIARANLVVANGLGLEEGLEDFLETAASDGVAVVEVGPLADPVELTGGGLDPHIWFDLDRVGTAAMEIADALFAVDESVDWRVQAEQYVARLREADDSVRSTIDSIPPDRRKLITNHESLGYFARKYGLDIVAVVIPGGSTLAEPSSADLAEVVDAILTNRVDVIFAETTSSDRLANAVARESGREVEVVTIATEELGDHASLIDLILDTAESIARALSR